MPDTTDRAALPARRHDAFIEKAAQTVADIQAHDHPKREDWYCMNLVGWLGEHGHAFLEHIAALEAEKEALLAAERFRAAQDEAARLREALSGVRSALAHIQWGDIKWLDSTDMTKGVGEWCPFCQLEKSAGHAPGCIVAEALALAASVSGVIPNAPTPATPPSARALLAAEPAPDAGTEARDALVEAALFAASTIQERLAKRGKVRPSEGLLLGAAKRYRAAHPDASVEEKEVGRG